jgi:hypothetical protein
MVLDSSNETKSNAYDVMTQLANHLYQTINQQTLMLEKYDQRIRNLEEQEEQNTQQKEQNREILSTLRRVLQDQERLSATIQRVAQEQERLSAIIQGRQGRFSANR